MEDLRKEDEIIRISSKPMGNYLSAIAIKIEKYKEIKLTAFGRNLDMIFDLAERATRLFPLKIVEIKSFSQKNSGGLDHKGILIRLQRQKEVG